MIYVLCIDITILLMSIKIFLLQKFINSSTGSEPRKNFANLYLLDATKSHYQSLERSDWKWCHESLLNWLEIHRLEDRNDNPDYQTSKDWIFQNSAQADRQTIYNTGHDILELYNVLVQVQFATSETKLDILYNKLGIRVAKHCKN